MQSSKFFFLIIALIAAPAITLSSRQLRAQPQSSTRTEQRDFDIVLTAPHLLTRTMANV